MLPSTLPKCYGLFDLESELCAQCLANHECFQASLRISSDERRINFLKAIDIPKDKKRMILATCVKFGIPTTYHSSKYGRDFTVTEENLNEFYNIDCLLTTKSALLKFLTANVEVNNETGQ